MKVLNPIFNFSVTNLSKASYFYFGAIQIITICQYCLMLLKQMIVKIS